MKTSLLGKWKFARIDMAGMAAIAAGALLVYWFGVRPVVLAKDLASAQRSQLDAQRRGLAHTASRADAAAKRLIAIRAELAKLPVQLEPAGSVNTRIRRLADLAAADGLKIDEIQPSDAAYGPDFGWVPIRLAGGGGYKAWTAFLHDLAMSFPDTAVDSFELSGKPGAPTSPVEFRVSLVWFVSPQAVVARN
ncbi:MAG: hypothetical protein ACE15C_02150 [Phycisphaerae bacterium]